MNDRRRFLKWWGLGIAGVLVSGREWLWAANPGPSGSTAVEKSGTGTRRPSIDLAAPGNFTTATFALG